jgi:hypothetical protein
MSAQPKPAQIYQKISAVMSEIEAIGKDRKNQQQNYSFRGIDDVYNELHPLLAKHGIFSVPEVLEQSRAEKPNKSGGLLLYSILKIRYTFFAEDGSSIQATVVGEGMDSGDKASNKAMAVAHKYALMQLFAIPTEESKDPEDESPAPAVAPVRPPVSKGKAVASAVAAKLDKKVEVALPRDAVNARLMSLYQPFNVKFPQTDWASLLTERYGVHKTGQLTIEQCEDFANYLESRMKGVK